MLAAQKAMIMITSIILTTTAVPLGLFLAMVIQHC